MALTREQKAAIAIIRKQMHEYDCLADASKLRYIRHVIAMYEPKQASRSCAHGRLLHEPCVACDRWDDRTIVCNDGVFNQVVTIPGETRVYLQAAMFRIKELLQVIEAL